MFETVSDMVVWIVTIVLCIAGYVIYRNLKIISKVNAVFEEIEILYNIEYGDNDTKSNIKKRVYNKCLIFGKLIKCQKIVYSDVEQQQKFKTFYKQGDKKQAYLYCLIKEMVLYGDCKCNFGYELLDYCERMMIENDNCERCYIRNCLNFFIINHRKYFLDAKYAFCLHDLYCELSFIDYAYYHGDDGFDIDRIIDYIVSARENIKEDNYHRCNDLIDEFFDLFIECIKCNSENYLLQRVDWSVLYLPCVEENTPANNETNTGEETTVLGEMILLGNAELKDLYNTDFESFWEMVVKEAESLSTIPDCVYNYITDDLEYGENATRIFLNRMKFIVERANLNELLKIKNELMTNSSFKKLCMMDVIEEYERQNIVY